MLNRGKYYGYIKPEKPIFGITFGHHTNDAEKNPFIYPEKIKIKITFFYFDKTKTNPLINNGPNANTRFHPDTAQLLHDPHPPDYQSSNPAPPE